MRGVLALGLLLLVPPAGRAASEETKRVLIVHSFGSAAPPFTTHSTAFETALTQDMGKRVDLDEISLDMARYAQPDMEGAFVEFLMHRLAKWQPHLIVPVGSPAGRFVSKHRDRLFPDTPVIYTGMDRRTLPPNAFQKNATFVGEDFDLAGLAEDILQLAPETTDVYVVLGASPLERYWTVEFQRAFHRFTDRVRFTWLNDLSFDQMLERAATLPPRSFILLALLLRDASGVTHNEDDALQRLRAVTTAPINGLYQHQLGLGIVGGRLYQAELQGAEAARIAIRILRGEPASSFPPLIVPSQTPRYDWRELRRWNISERRLPVGSVVVFRQPTAWERYRWWVIGAVIIGTVQTGSILCLALNLVKRRRAERALRESESRFRTVADSAPILIWMSGADKRRTFVNKPWLDFTGRTASQETGSGWTASVHPDDLPDCLEAYANAFDARQPFVLQYRLRRHDGEYRLVSDHGVPRYDAHGAFAGYIASGQDVTDRARAEERFRQVFEAAPNAMIMVNEQGKIVLVNNRVETVFGYPREELVGLSIEALLPDRFRRQHPGDRDRFSDAPKARTMGAGRDVFGRRKDGSEVPVEIGLNPIRTTEGLFVVASVVDISERRRAEAESSTLRQELTHISRVAILGELTAAIVHELSQPLSAILSNAQAGVRLHTSGKPDPGATHEILEDIVADGLRARQVVLHLSPLFKRSPGERRPVSLNRLIGAVVDVAGNDASRRGVAIVLDLAPGLRPVSGDGIQLEQVLLNLVLNAFDAMADVADRPRQVTLRTRALGKEHVQVEVRDTGVGIAREDLETIFRPFVSTKADGMGIGLWVSHSIVQAHGGRLWAENDREGGAVFRMVLPAGSDEETK
jgi:PAS domain S-box-containing protein